MCVMTSETNVWMKLNERERIKKRTELKQANTVWNLPSKVNMLCTMYAGHKNETFRLIYLLIHLSSVDHKWCLVYGVWCALRMANIFNMKESFASSFLHTNDQEKLVSPNRIFFRSGICCYCGHPNDQRRRSDLILNSSFFSLYFFFLILCCRIQQSLSLILSPQFVLLISQLFMCKLNRCDFIVEALKPD